MNSSAAGLQWISRRRCSANSSRSGSARNATINRNLALLRRMLTLAREEELLQTVPYFPKLHEPEARQGFCDVDKFGDLYHHLPERLRTISLFLYTTGCRIGEAKKLRWDQVDWAARVIRVEGLQTKNKTARTIPLTGPVYDRLQAIPEASRAGLLFPVGCFRKAWQSACLGSGWPCAPDPQRHRKMRTGDNHAGERRSAMSRLMRSPVSRFC